MTTTISQLAEETVDAAEARVTADFIAFLKAATLRRQPTGPVRRFNQGRAAGCVHAQFTVLDTLAAVHRVGIFAIPRTFEAWIRFANASSQSDREKDVRGMAIRLSGVPGQNLTPGATRQDFVLNSHPVMVAANTKDFLELLKAMDAGGLRQVSYFLSHPRSAMIGFQARQQPTSHLDIPYWSATPYLFGREHAVKYVVQPISTRGTALPNPLTDTYLRDRLRAHLRESDASFEFFIQFQTDTRRMPIEDATVEWREADSPYVRVARIRIPRQDIDAAGRAEACEQISFNPWHCLADHRPLGSLNRARREIYEAMSQLRAARVGT
jgi:hypothetical protein